MYHSIGIKLKSKDSGKMDLFTGKKLQAIFLSLINEIDPELSSFLHDENQLKNYTVSPLLGLKSGNVEEEKNYYFRVTFLNEILFDLFMKKIGINLILKTPIFLENYKFIIEEIIYKNSKLAGKSSLNNYKSKKINLKFMTPTIFKNGDFHIKYPELKYVFNSLLNRYNKYNENKIDKNFILENLHWIQYEKIDTRLKRLKMKKFFLEGFVGECTIKIATNNQQFIEDINNLIEFAFFSGIGQKTAMGLGQFSSNHL